MRAAAMIGGFAMLRVAAAAPLPQAPILERGAHTFIAFTGHAAKIRIRFTPVVGATGYRATWLTSGSPVELELPATATVFEHAEPIAGHHTLTLVAIVDGRDSPPVELGVDVVAITAIAPGFAADDTPRTPAFATGARFSSPGLSCRLGAGTPAVEVTAIQPGRTTLHCGGEPGQPTIDLPLIVAPVRVASEAAPLPRGTATTVHVTLASVAALGDHLDIHAVGDVDVGAPVRTELGLDVPVTPHLDATRAGLRIAAGAYELGHVDLALGDALPPAIPARDEPAWFALDLGVQTGAFLPPFEGMQSNNIGHPQRLADTVTGGPLGGGRIGFYPTRRVGLEAEVELAGNEYETGRGAGTILLSRLQIAARVVDDGRYGLRLVAGGDLVTELATRGTSHPVGEGGIHYGAAFSVDLTRSLTLRFEALDVITPAQDASFAHSIELQLGAVTRLGRPDRGW